MTFSADALEDDFVFERITKRKDTANDVEARKKKKSIFISSTLREFKEEDFKIFWSKFALKFSLSFEIVSVGTKIGQDSNENNILIDNVDIDEKGICGLIISGSGIKCAKLIRSVKSCNPKAKPAKLFSKHLKIEDQKKFILQNKSNIGVGTPNRLLKIFEAGCLQNLKWIAIDLGCDEKERTILDMQEVSADLFKLLSRLSCTANPIKLLFF